MNITISSFDDVNNPYYGGGGAISIHEVAKRLARKHKVRVVTGDFPGSKEEVRDGVVYKRIGTYLLGPRIAQLTFQFLLPFAVLKGGFDVWLESFTPPFSSAFLPLFTKKPVVGLTHFLGASHMEQKYKLPFFSIIEKTALSFYDNFIAITLQLKNQVRSKNKSARIEIIHNGMLVDPYSESMRANKTHILFIGRLDIYQKGIDMLLETYARYKKRINLPLIIAGYGSSEDVLAVKRMIHSLGLDDTVTYIGKISGEKKKHALLTSVMTVAPSRFESFGLSILEAFYYKSPVITFAIPDLSWIDDSYCKKIRPFDLDQFGRAMVKLSHDKKERNKYTRKASRFATQFSWEDTSKKYDEFLTEIHIKSQTTKADNKNSAKPVERKLTK